MGNINTRFKKLRTILKCSQKEFADNIGISRTHLSGIENGKDNPSIPLIKLVCLKYGVNEEWLIDESGSIFVKDIDFDSVTDKGLKAKYNKMKDFFEKMMDTKTGRNLENVVQMYSDFVSLVTMPGLSEGNQDYYIESLYGVICVLEQLSFKSYMLKSVSNSDYKALLEYKTKIDSGINEINVDIREALSIYLIEYGKDLSL